jgi:hypothetical protein
MSNNSLSKYIAYSNEFLDSSAMYLYNKNIYITRESLALPFYYSTAFLLFLLLRYPE